MLKSDRPSRVHRAGAMDVIAVKTYDARGKATGERRFVGLFTSSAYHASPREIPLLRRKVEAVLDRAGYDPASHDGKALFNIIETLPRDELFQADEDALFAIATGVLQLQERQRVALFTRPDAAGRFVACLVYAPRDNIRHRVAQAIRRRSWSAPITARSRTTRSASATNWCWRACCSRSGRPTRWLACRIRTPIEQELTEAARHLERPAARRRSSSVMARPTA